MSSTRLISGEDPSGVGIIVIQRSEFKKKNLVVQVVGLLGRYRVFKFLGLRAVFGTGCMEFCKEESFKGINVLVLICEMNQIRKLYVPPDGGFWSYKFK